MLNKSKIFSVIVSYNPTKDELGVNLNELLKQIDFLVICNNSKDDLIFDHPRIKVLNFGDNLGIAKAQNIGMKWAYENGAEYVLQMDQDSLPDPEMVSLLYESYLALVDNKFNVGLIGPMTYDRYTKKIHNPIIPTTSSQKGKSVGNFEGIVLLDAVISSGCLISKKTFQEMGGVLDELFIDAVDFEYCWRLKSNGFVIVRNNNARLAHRFGNGRKKIIYGIDIAVCSPIRHYYQFRNFIYLCHLAYVPATWKVRGIFKILFKIFCYPILLGNGKERIIYMLLGLKDGIKKKMYSIDTKL